MGTYVYLWLIDAVVWQKPAQHCKPIIPQLKIDFFFKKKGETIREKILATQITVRELIFIIYEELLETSKKKIGNAIGSHM